MVQHSVVVVEAQEERADALAVLVGAEPRDDAVGRAQVLHLEHRALALAVGGVERLRDHTVEPRTLEATEPVARDVGILGRGGEVDGGRSRSEHRLEAGAALGERRGAEIVVTLGEQIERDEGCRRRLGEHGHAALRRMDAQREEVEVETSCRSR